MLRQVVDDQVRPGTVVVMTGVGATTGHGGATSRRLWGDTATVARHTVEAVSLDRVHMAVRIISIARYLRT